MKSKKLRLSALFIAVLLIGLSNSSNPPNGRTGAPGDTFCTDCHGNPSSSIDGFIDISGVPNNIDPNTTYTLTVTSEFTSGAPTRAGFQMVVLDSNNEDFGSLSNASASSTITPSGGRTYFEHSPAMNFNGNSSVSWEVDWTSPSGPDMEDITFYASTILANGNGNTNTDKMKLTNVSGTLDAPIIPMDLEILEQTDITCFGFDNGTAAIAVNGGTPPYSYEWSNGETNEFAQALLPGDNSLTVTDDLGSTETITVSINEPDELELIFEFEDISCFDLTDGMIFTSVSGGTGNYSYDWSNGENSPNIFNLSVGIYDVIIQDDNGCELFQEFFISEPAPISINTVNILDANCLSLGSIDIETTGGTGTLSSTWSNGLTGNSITNLDEGSYSVTVSDQNNCTFTQVFDIQGPTALNYSSESENIDCNGADNGSAELFFVSSSDYSSIDWSTGATTTAIFDLPPGNYSVTIEDNFLCQYEEVFTILEPEAIQVNAILTDVSCDGLGSIEVLPTGGTGVLVAEWSTGETGLSITELPAGNYSVEIFDENNCGIFESFTIAGNEELSFDSSQEDVNCNGANNGSIELIFNSPDDYESILWSTGETTTSIENLNAGIYEVTIVGSTGCEISQIFTIQEPEVLSFSAETVNPILCSGLTTDVNLVIEGGTAPYSVFNNGEVANPTITNLTAGDYIFSVIDANGCEITLAINLQEPLPLATSVITSSASSPTSMDGSAQITVSGGTAPYSADGSVIVNNLLEFTGLASGTYTANIMDVNGCLTMVSYSISNGASPCDDLELDLAVTLPTCIGDEPIFDPIITGGTPPYTSTWVSLDMYNGDYSISFVDANNCSVSQVVTINYLDTEPPVLNPVDISVSLDQNGNLEPIVFGNIATDNCGSTVTIETLDALPDCFSGPGPNAINVIATDELGNSTTAIVMITIIDDFAPTIFCLDDTTISSCVDFNIPDPIVTDNCNDFTLTIIENEELELGENEIIYIAQDIYGNADTCIVVVTVDVEIDYEVIITNPSCFGEFDGAVEIIGQDSLTVTFENNQLDSLGAGAYFFTITDEISGCIISDSLTIVSPEPISIINEIIFPLSAAGASDGAVEISVAGGSIPYTYNWFDEGGIVVSTEAAANSLVEGMYFCEVTDANGCILQTQSYSISFESSISENHLDQVEIYPNPFDQEIFVNSPRVLDYIKIYNAQGKLVYTQKEPSNAINMDLLDTGLYLIEICESDKKAFKRIIKQ